MTLVLDASVTLAWLLHEGGGWADALFERLLSEAAVVPSHWPLEIANTLLTAERRGRIGADFREAAVADLAALPIAIDLETADRAWRTTLGLAAHRNLTAYDAAYLELAKRLGASLATLDSDLARAARAEGVPLAIS